MNRTLFFFIIASLLAFDTESNSQTKLSSYKRVLIFRSSNFDPQTGLSVKSPPVSGYLTAMVEDTLHVLTISGEESISKVDISRVIVRAEPRSGNGLGYGMLLGSYAGLYLIGTRNQSGTFLHSNLSDNPWVILLGLLPGLAVGAGVGYVVDPGSDGIDMLFEINNDDTSNQTEWHRLAEELKPLEIRKFHISIQGSHLYNFNFGGQFMNGYGSEDFSSFNLIRKLQCTYSFSPQLEAGIAMAPFGALGVNGFSYENSTQGISRYYYMDKSLKSTGYYFVAQYQPLSRGISERFDLNVGGGIGWMSIDYQRNINVTVYDNTNSNSQNIGPFHFTDSRSELSAMLYSEITMQLYEDLTLGIIFDRLMVEGSKDPGELSIGYAPSTLNLGTWSLGFTLGIHL